MKIPAIKRLVENVPLEDLIVAEQALLNEEQLTIEVEGNDDGEKLTHLIAAIWILSRMQSFNEEFKVALRGYTQKVRESIT